MLIIAGCRVVPEYVSCRVGGEERDHCLEKSMITSCRAIEEQDRHV